MFIYSQENLYCVNNTDLAPPSPRGVAWVSKQLWRVNQGLYRINVIWALIGFLTFIGVWKTTLTYFGINIGMVFLVLGTLYFATSWTVGYLNETKQFSRQEWLHSIKIQNPEWFQLLADVELMKAQLDRIETRQKIGDNNGR